MVLRMPVAEVVVQDNQPLEHLQAEQAEQVEVVQERPRPLMFMVPLQMELQTLEEVVGDTRQMEMQQETLMEQAMVEVA